MGCLWCGKYSRQRKTVQNWFEELIPLSSRWQQQQLGGPCHIACYAGYFFFSQAARGQWAHVFEISPFALRKKKTRKSKQTNKNKGVSQQFSDLIDSCGTRTIGPGYLKSLWQLSPLVPICNGLKQEGIGREIIHFAGPKTFSQKLCFPRFYCLPRQSILVFFTA